MRLPLTPLTMSIGVLTLPARQRSFVCARLLVQRRGDPSQLPARYAVRPQADGVVLNRIGRRERVGRRARILLQAARFPSRRHKGLRDRLSV